LQLALIEGFFGRSWQQPARLDSISWLAANGYGLYVYAPKEDGYLRGQWQQAGDDAWIKKLKQLAQACTASGVDFGVGLSPLGAVHDFNGEAREALAAKLRQLDAIGVKTLAILFDDMRCEFVDLAARQLSVIDFIVRNSKAQRFVVCPSYYSFDPVLARVFGEMPSGYWQELGQGLAEDIDLLWTGNKVCSESIALEDMQAAATALGRMPILWDNYPVNDGEKACQFLYLHAFKQREPHLQQHLPGHWVNPMNECYLSRPALASLPQLYREAENYETKAVTADQLQMQFGEYLGKALISDLELVAEKGLQQLSAQEKQAMRERYLPFQENPAANEIVQWLDGAFAFDPACLTEV
jgi:hypothetical protein